MSDPPGASSAECIDVEQSACACVGSCLGSACLGVGDACACACVEQSVGRSHGPSVFQSVAYPAEVRPRPSPMEQGWNDLRELFGDEGVDEVEGLAEAERVAEIERQRSDNINPTRDPEMIDSFPEDISAESKLRHQRQGHVPYSGAHVFEGFFGLENGPVKSDKSQEKTLFGKDFPKPAKTQS